MREKPLNFFLKGQEMGKEKTPRTPGKAQVLQLGALGALVCAQDVKEGIPEVPLL